MFQYINSAVLMIRLYNLKNKKNNFPRGVETIGERRLSNKMMRQREERTL